MSKEFTCSLCNETYKKNWSDKEAWEEYNKLMPECTGHPVSVVCDDCYREFKAWFATQSESDKKRMREEFVKENYQ